MDEPEISLRRAQMGRGGATMLSGGPSPVEDHGPGYWVVRSGAPSADVNMALVDVADAATLANAIGQVERSGTPTLFVLAGEGCSLTVGPPWQLVAEMPFMASDLSDEHLQADERVRLKLGADDFDTVNALMCDAFGLESEMLSGVVAGMLAEPDGPTKIWLLEEEGVGVSTVATSMVDDAITVWCMSTPERFARHGYGRAVLADCLTRAKAGGATIGLLGATPAGKPLYDSTGWTVLEQWQVFASEASAQFDN